MEKLMYNETMSLADAGFAEEQPGSDVYVSVIKASDADAEFKGTKVIDRLPKPFFRKAARIMAVLFYDKVAAVFTANLVFVAAVNDTYTVAVQFSCSGSGPVAEGALLTAVDMLNGAISKDMKDFVEEITKED